MPVFIFVLYRLVQILGFPLILLYLLWRGLKNRHWMRSINGRFGGLPFQVTATGGIWLHAVSVGEVLSAATLIRALREKLPDTPIYVSVTTITGHALAVDKLTALTDGVFYTPLDFCFAVRRVLRAIRPSILVVMETEIWPNLWRETKRTGAGLLVINARISDHALPKYRKFSWFFAPVLALPDAIYAQSEQDADRYLSAGAPREKLHLGRNLKYDFEPRANAVADDLRAWIERTNAADIVIAASTMPGIDATDFDEDILTLDAFESLAARRAGLLWIHVPRRPERFDSAAEKLRARGIRFVRRTALGELQLPGVLLLDTLGELGPLFAHAGAVFMGGTLVRRGGHNILEPAFCGKPVVAGPHMENFAEIAREFTDAQALERISAADELAPALEKLLDHGAAIGQKARAIAESKRGATKIARDAAIEILEESWPTPRHSLLARALLGPLSLLWRWFSHSGLERKFARRQTLDAPVISIGGLAMGGTGKTPMVLHLARAFAAQGKRVAILTRGYKRMSTEPITLIAKGDQAPVFDTGDEAQIFVRAGIAHLGIAADRISAGRKLLETMGADVVLLDDGFQHRQLARKFDLLLLDAQDPFAGNAVFPLGRLREDPSRLARADAIVLTRVQRGRAYKQLLRRIEKYKPSMPVCYSHVEPEPWQPALAEGKAAAFCGLGNPASFWATLRKLDIEPCYRWAFGDHHQYRPNDLKRLRHHALHAGATHLVTTEKDAVNLPAGADELLAPLTVHYLPIGVAIDGDAALIDRIFRH
ncbi:MAG: tetraacyldisaccharide 4'-kinase [Acidobacteria bacterium]|nr:tetraacyldisaccharide 4'-kinase [Acidobacteriota bacterium]